ncbi:MAG: GHKL domain-containing protein [Lachnospiraceae bacterium]|nr:GHKL domain-containing protein [Lachnospiraceae bacterium]
MMDCLIRNFQTFAEGYSLVTIEVYLFLVSALFAYWLKPFTSNGKSAYLTALAYWILTTINNHTGTSKEIDRVIAIGILALSVLTLWILDNKQNPIQKIFLCVLFRLISWLSIELLSEIGFFERDFIFRFDWYNSSIKAIVLEFIIWNLIFYALSLILLYAVIRILHRIYKHKSEELTWHELAILLTPAFTLLLVKPIISSYFLLWMDGIKNGSITENIPANIYRAAFCIFALFPIIIILALLQDLKEKQEEALIKESVSKQVEDAESYTSHIDDIYEKMRAFRHDIGNHLTVISGLAENGNTKELSDYIGELQTRFSEVQPSIRTGNAVTDVVLSEIADQCGKEQIQFSSTFVFPEKLGINPFDMSVILNNALKNAVDASKDVPGAAICIKSISRDRVLLISIKNRITDRLELNEEGLIDSTKKQGGHGYGLKNIRNIAGKYKGDIEIHQEETNGELFFVLNIMLMG